MPTIAKPPPFLPYARTKPGPAFEAQRFRRGHAAQRFGAHGHRFHELVVFDSAGGRHRVAGQSREIGVGDVDVVAEGVSHDTTELADATGWMLLVRADELDAAVPPDAARLFEAGSAVRLRLTGSRFARVRMALEAIAQEADRGERGFGAAMRAYLSIILLELGRARGEPAAAFRRSSQLERRNAAIDARLAAEIRLRDLADALGLTPGHLTSELRRQTGRTAMDWVMVRRLSRARRLLVETSASVAAIAVDTGFADGGHFARRFRREFGTSPAAWRKQMQVGLNLGLHQLETETCMYS